MHDTKAFRNRVARATYEELEKIADEHTYVRMVEAIQAGDRIDYDATYGKILAVLIRLRRHLYLYRHPAA